MKKFLLIFLLLTVVIRLGFYVDSTYNKLDDFSLQRLAVGVHKNVCVQSEEDPKEGIYTVRCFDQILKVDKDGSIHKEAINAVVIYYDKDNNIVYLKQ